jgi:phospholipid/cholesterol/gamma-HCH transport system permease protein
MFEETKKGFTFFLEGLYNGTDLFVKTLAASFQKPFEKENVRDQMYEIGTRSFPVTALTSLFTGMVLALQSGYSTISVFNEPLYVGTVVTFSLVKELAPVLTATVIMGRVGAAITAEIGTMKVTEQIDALHTLGTNPIKYLAVPRFLACISMLPLLTVFSDIIGVFGGFLVSRFMLDIPSTIYWSNVFDFIDLSDFFHGFLKSAFFGVLIAIISIYKGFRCSGGAEGVGKATTSAVVTAIVLILVSDYFLSTLLVAFGIG